MVKKPKPDAGHRTGTSVDEAWNDLFDTMRYVREDVDAGEHILEFDGELPDKNEHFLAHHLFVESGLDPKNPGHWEYLLLMITLEFERDRSKRSKDWSLEDCEQLLADFESVASKCPPGNVSCMSREVIAAYPKKYSMTAGSLRVQFYDAYHALARLERRTERQDELLKKFVVRRKNIVIR